MLLGTSAKNSLGSSKKIEKKPKLPISNMKRKAALIEQVSKKSQQTNQSTIIIHQSKISPDVYIYIYICASTSFLFTRVWTHSLRKVWLVNPEVGSPWRLATTMLLESQLSRHGAVFDLHTLQV